MPTPTRKKIPASAQAVPSRREDVFLNHNESNESLDWMRFSDDFFPSAISHDTEKTSKSTLMLPPNTTDASLGEQESNEDKANSSQVDGKTRINDEMPPRDDRVGSPDGMRLLKDFFSTPIVEDISITPARSQMSSRMSTNAENGFLKETRYTNEFLSPRILTVTPKAPKSARISPRIIQQSSSQNNSHECDNTIDEYTNFNELSSNIPCSARRVNVTMRDNILDESSPNFSEACSPRESVFIIEEIITLNSSSEDENQISDDTEDGVANESLDEAEYDKYLQLKAKYERKRKPELYSKLRAPK